MVYQGHQVLSLSEPKFRRNADVKLVAIKLFIWTIMIKSREHGIALFLGD